MFRKKHISIFFVCAWVFVCVYVYIYICICVYICMYMYMYKFMWFAHYTHTHTCTNVSRNVPGIQLCRCVNAHGKSQEVVCLINSSYEHTFAGNDDLPTNSPLHILFDTQSVHTCPAITTHNRFDINTVHTCQALAQHTSLDTQILNTCD